METSSAWKKYDAAEEERLEDLAGRYRAFISECKTERECVARAVAVVEEKGYLPLEDAIAEGRALQPGD